MFRPLPLIIVLLMAVSGFGCSLIVDTDRPLRLPDDADVATDGDPSCTPESGCDDGIACTEMVCVEGECVMAEGGDTRDRDHDGFTSVECGGGDCDDGNANVNPSVQETCDGVDQNCDGVDAECTMEPVSSLSSGDIIITEIMQNPAAVSDSSGEWFEIYNASGFDVDLEGLQVVDDGTDSFEVSGSLPFFAGSYLVFGAELDTGLNGGVDVDYEFSGSCTLANSTDEIYLINEYGVIDGVAWDNGATFPDPSGASMSLDPDYTDPVANDFGENWCEASSPYGDGDAGTPGSPNDDCP